MKPSVVLVAAGLVATACTRPSPLFVESSWNLESAPRKKPAFLTLPSQSLSSADWKDGRVEFSAQTVEGVEIDGSFVRKVYDRSASLREAQARTVPEKIFPQGLRRQLRAEKGRGPEILEALRARHDGLKRAHVEDIRPVILPGPEPEFAWSLTFSDPEGLLWRAIYSATLVPVSVTALGSEFTDVAALAFPKGPRESRLSSVLLQGLIPGENLVSGTLRLGTAAPENVIVTGAALNYQPGDIRFDQVQAYYFAQQALMWLARNAGFNPGVPLDVQTHLGFPTKTNTAFYYAGRIRLGEGDGVVYRHLSQDPGIVMHEVAHYLIDAIARLPTDGEGGSLNEAFADFLSASMRDNPLLGDVAYVPAPFRRRLDVRKNLSEKSGSLYGDSLIVSSLLWELRGLYGPERANALALGALGRLNPLGTFEDFRSALTTAAPRILKPAELLTLNALLKERGWRTP